MIEHTHCHGQNKGIGNKNKDTPQKPAEAQTHFGSGHSSARTVNRNGKSVKTERCPLKTETEEFITDTIIIDKLLLLWLTL